MTKFAHFWLPYNKPGEDLRGLLAKHKGNQQTALQEHMEKMAESISRLADLLAEVEKGTAHIEEANSIWITISGDSEVIDGFLTEERDSRRVATPIPERR